MGDKVRPVVGDRVRVVIEGQLGRITSGGALLVRPTEVGPCWVFPEPEHALVASVEVLPPPEPAWEPGDVVITPEGSIFTRRTPDSVDAEKHPWVAGGWLIDGWDGVEVFRDNELPRPLALIARNGKPVQAS